MAWSLKSAAGSLPCVLGVGLAIRLLLLVHGHWQDNNLPVKYTDIDYVVFTDASRFVAEHQSPYERSTYRYTPLLAFLLLPNVWSPLWGKLLFILFDLGVGVLLVRLMDLLRPFDAAKRESGAPSPSLAHVRLVAVGWLLNPVVINVSTRGNAESLICLLVVGCLYLLHKPGWLVPSAIVFGLAVHVKIYPVIYALAIVLYLTKRKHPLWMQQRASFRQLSLVINQDTVTFALVSASVMLGLSVWMCALYGYQFLDQAYFYHLYRADHRHNMSLYFYHLYLSSAGSAEGGSFIAILMFLPQLVLLLVISWYYSNAHSLILGVFLLTCTFVTFNKVCTVQYFVWYLALLPPVLASSRMPAKEYLRIGGFWLGAQALWLAFGYLLEFQGLNVFLGLFGSGILFFASNIHFISSVIQTTPP